MDGFDEYGFDDEFEDEDLDLEMDDGEGEFEDAATFYGFVEHGSFEWAEMYDNDDPYVYDDDNVIGYD